MLSQIKRFATNLFSRLSSTANRLFRRITQPACANRVTGTLADLPRSRIELLAENALLRQPLSVLHRRNKTPRLTWRERRSRLFLARCVPNWKQVLPIIQPDTRLRWQRAGFRLFWKWKSRVRVRTQPPRLAAETMARIEPMARENPWWGAERIRGEWLKWEIKVSKRTIQKYRRVVRSKPPTGPSGSTFLKTHGQDIGACACVPGVTLCCKTLHACGMVHPESRRVVPCGVTELPTDAWVTQPLRAATPCDEKPQSLIGDNDQQDGEGFERLAKASGIDVMHTRHEAPQANAICERLVGSLRRECLDHVRVLGVLQWMRILKEYVDYFNRARPHQGMGQRIPEATQSPPREAKAGKVIAFPVLNGLHHDYRRAA